MDENPYRVTRFGPGGPPHRGPLVTVFKLLAAVVVIGLVIALLLPLRRSSPEAGRRNSCANNLKQIALALRNYADRYGALPPAHTVDADGKPLHSWRTLVLPFMEANHLYATIDLSKPWDDPANAKAFNVAPSKPFQCPSRAGSIPAVYTTYLAVVGPNSCFLADAPRKFSEIRDGAAKTLMVIEVDVEHAVSWMAPIDADEQLVLGIGPNSKLAHPGGVQAAFVDGSVHFLDADMPADQRRAMISIAGDDNGVLKDEN